MKRQPVAPNDRTAPVHVAFDMENDISTVKDYGTILGLIAETIKDSDTQDAVARIGFAVIEYSQRIEADRMRLWQGLCDAQRD